MVSWTTRLYQQNDEYAITELFKLVFEQDMPIERWRWQYLDNPLKWVAILLAEADDKRLVGQYALCPLPMKIGDRDIVGALSLDTMVHPDFRGQGLFTALAKELYDRIAREGVPIVYGFPNEQSHSGFVKRLQWIDLCDDLPVYVRPLNFAKLLDRLVPVRLLAHVGSSIAELGYRVARGPRGVAQASSQVTLVSEFDERVDDLWYQARDIAPILIRRQRNYLNWRYASHPEHHYKILVVEDDDRISGYAVLGQHVVDDLLVGFVMDLLVEPGSVDVVDLLLEEVVAHAKGEGCDLISCLMLAHSPYVQGLKRQGFVRAPASLIPQEIYLGARNNSSDLPDRLIHSSSNWYVTWGDHDRI
ncbi:MAG: hypothetical protein Kow0063_25980 [Anaerolineae bacterium]